MEKYSLKIGARKASLHLLTVIAALVAFAGFSDLMVWELLEKYVKPVIGSLSVGAVIALAINWIKFHWTA